MAISPTVRLVLTGGIAVLGVLVWVSMVLLVDSATTVSRLDETYGSGRRATYVTGVVLSVGVAVPLFYSVGAIDSTWLAWAGALSMFVGALLFGRAVDNGRPFLTLRGATRPSAGDAGAERIAVTGTVRSDGTAAAPFSGTGAVAWTVRVLGKSRVAFGRERGYDLLVDERGGKSFTLEGTTRRVRVDPTVAKLRLDRDLRAEVSSDEGVPPSIGAFLAERGAGSFDDERIFFESRLQPGETATVIGSARVTENGALLVGGDGSPIIEDGDRSSTLATYRWYVLHGGLIGVTLSVLGIGGLLVTL